MSDYEAWLKDLKPGDKVRISGGGFTRPDSIATLVRVTSTGRFIAGGKTFNPNGFERCAPDPSYRRARLCRATPEDEERIERNNIINRLGSADWQKPSLPALRRIAAILDEVTL